MNLAVTCPTGGKGEAIIIRRGYYFCACFVGEEMIGEDLGPFFISASQVLSNSEPHFTH